ncbi:ABC transporter family substrate-binding protein [Corynebacterium bovis]|uniref:ABC transporter family substrate-binding protein n=1 Tax=Corynebacterium bovis TaxID=36808 RepID=UPI003138E40F
MRTRRNRRRLCAAVVAAGVVVSGCQAHPGDAPTVDDRQLGERDGGENPSPHDAATAEAARTVTVGVDSFAGNLNPHLIGGVSPVTAEVASLTLPSAFIPRQATGAGGPQPVTAAGEEAGDVDRVLNRDLLTSATVTAGDAAAPTAVRYEITPQAQWSDGTPITGSDFQYLRDMMVSSPGVADPSGYERIDSVEVSGGGRTVDVTFRGPYAGWHSLFRDLLPSHIYRSEAKDFQTMMDGAVAASGGPFQVHSVDAGRGVIELTRNDRYWGSTPAATDKLALTTVPSAATGAQMLRTGQIQMYLTRPGQTTGRTLAQVPGVRTGEVDRRVMLGLFFNQGSPLVADRDRRTALASVLDPALIAQITTGREDVTVPSRPEVPSGDPAAATAEPGAQGAPARPLRIAAATDDTSAVIAARTVVDELTTAGVDATVVTVDPADLYGSYLPEGEVDAVVAWQTTDDTARDYADHYTCGRSARAVTTPSRPVPGLTAETPTATSTTAPAAPGATSGTAATTTTGTAPAPSSGTARTTTTTTGTAPAPVSATTTTTGARDPRRSPASAVSARAANLTGMCDPGIDAAVDRVRSGAAPLDSVREELDARVSAQASVVPFLRDHQVLAVSRQLEGAPGPVDEWPTDPVAGPFVAAGQWRRGPVPARPTDGDDQPEEALRDGFDQH